MGLINSIVEWRNAQYDKRIAKMEARGICPDCRGRGFNVFANEYYYSSSHIECGGCNGSGSFADWNGR
ncbi:methionine aminopeptidase [Evansella sp. AB-rgal1]|uniref:methionine aminopeptidase n=1 Tax=Evansella sp. AB-rgal1 TaxID=3242696 RepID=UPI00359D4D0E